MKLLRKFNIDLVVIFVLVVAASLILAFAFSQS